MYICVNIFYDLSYKNIYRRKYKKTTKQKIKYTLEFNVFIILYMLFQCSECDFRKLFCVIFNSYFLMIVYNKVIHIREKAYQCILCGRSTMSFACSEYEFEFIKLSRYLITLPLPAFG